MKRSGITDWWNVGKRRMARILFQKLTGKENSDSSSRTRLFNDNWVYFLNYAFAKKTKFALTCTHHLGKHRDEGTVLIPWYLRAEEAMGFPISSGEISCSNSRSWLVGKVKKVKAGGLLLDQGTSDIPPSKVILFWWTHCHAPMCEPELSTNRWCGM